MNRPVIGITTIRWNGIEGLDNHTYFISDQGYNNAVWKEGGIPWILPFFEEREPIPEILDRMQGLILTGGDDVAPDLFGQEPRPGLGRVDRRRDLWEMALAREALDRNLPVLAICRGIQLLNVACGGTLIQHIPSEVQTPVLHSQKVAEETYIHSVAIEPDSLLHRIFGETEVLVNSYHHQAVDEPGTGVRVTARASDGVTEAIEVEGQLFALGIQWHPEQMVEFDSFSSLLFKGFVKACILKEETAAEA